MRFSSACALFLAAALTPGLNASIIVQQGLEESSTPFALFDPNLGTLNNVNLRYSVSNFPININVLSNSAQPVSVDYDLSIPFFTSYEVSNGSRRFGRSQFDATVAGRQQVNLQPQISPDFAYFGSLRLITGGFVESSLDPDIFVDRGDPNSRVPFGNFFNIGFREVAGTINTSRNDVRAFAFPGTQSSVNIGLVRLTYDFTPFASAVPEPGTWTMMLVGFGAIGYAMRRKPKAKVTIAGANSFKA